MKYLEKFKANIFENLSIEDEVIKEVLENSDISKLEKLEITLKKN